MTSQREKSNRDVSVIDSFGSEWARFDQSSLSDAELDKLFENYFRIFPFSDLPADAEGFDMGCGSGRWSRMIAPRVGKLNCIDPSEDALRTAKRKVNEQTNVEFHLAGTDDCPLAEESQDFGYSLGVLHHIPDTGSALKDCVRLLKPEAPFLLYLYYRFDNRPRWFRLIWRLSEQLRSVVSRLPEWLKNPTTDLIAIFVYFPLSRIARLAERLGLNAKNLPLYFYRDSSLYTLRTDARDRFGTALEQRFTKNEMQEMMADAGLDDIEFSDSSPFWVACGRRVK